jgi:hypothetical protein
MSQITQLATGQITAVDSITVELIETDQHPSVIIIITSPPKPNVVHPQRFPEVAAMMARVAAEVHTALRRW